MKRNDEELPVEDLACTEGPPSNQVVHLRSQNEVLKRQVKTLQKELGSQEELANRVIESVQAVTPPPRWHYAAAKRTGIRIVPVLKLSDWHIGEVVNAREVEGYNAFDWETAQERVQTIVQKFLRWVEVQRRLYCIEDCALFCEGDYVSGDIHPELVATNEFPLPVQTAHAGHLLGRVFLEVSAHFKRVRAVLVGADNHGRLQKKPQAKQKAANNMSYLVHTIAMSHAARARNVTYEVAEGMRHLAEVNGHRFLIEHGDTVRGWAGLPYYGFNRAIGREAKRRMNTARGFHYWSIAHFHVPNVIDNHIFVNGSLSGTSEFDHACGRHAEPAQVAFLVHPEHGYFNFTPFSGKAES